MSDDLGFGELLADDGLFAGLLGKTRAGRNRKALFGPDLPVVLLVGGAGMGKGRFLRCIRSGFGPHLPTAHIDCGSPLYRTRAAEEPETRTAATEALREIALQLGAWQGDGGMVATPRLYAGLVAIASSGSGGRAALVAEAQRHEVLLPPGAFWRGVVKKAAKGYLAALAALVAGPVTAPLTAAVLDELFLRVSPEGEAALQSCYGAYEGAGGQPKLGLHTLASDFRLGGRTRRYAESFLFRALREDVEAAYGGVHGWLSRGGRPALLLDRADCRLGRSLLRPVLEDREAGRFDRLVVVATARRADGGRFLHGPEGSEGDGPAAWLPAEGGQPAWGRPAGGVPGRAPLSRGVLLVRMPLLTRVRQRREIARLREPGLRGDNADLLRIEEGVHRLSGGRPRYVARLAEAVGRLRPPAGFTDWDLLDASVLPRHDTAGDARDDPPVARRLLDELILDQLPEELPAEHREHWLDLLSHLSVAHGMECAQTLARARQADRDEWLSAYRIDELLRDSGWPRCPRHFIGDLGLRHLLMWRLHRMRDGAAWREDHELLLQRYRSPQAGPEDAVFGSTQAHALNHRLCTGDAEAAAQEVTDHLCREFAARDPAEWSAELLAVAEAPAPGGPDGLRAGGHPESPQDGDALRRRMARLFQAVRACEDRAATVDDTVAGSLRSMLEHLADASPRGAEALDGLARDWSARAAGGQPLRSCSCTRHIG